MASNPPIVADGARRLNHDGHASAPDLTAETAALRPVDPRAVGVWRLAALLESGVALVVAAGVAAALWWLDLSIVFVVLPVVAALAFALIAVGVVPGRRWRSWRYAITDAEIELRHGIWWQTWTRIPMARVQHVDTRRGPLERRYGLADLVLYTAAGARQIPGLSIDVAEQSRDRIAVLANVRDDV